MLAEVIEQSAAPSTVEVELNYCGEMDHKPQHFTGGGAQSAIAAMNILPHRIAIRDGSRDPIGTNLDREGFVFTHRETKVTDFRNKQQIEDIYREEIRALLKELSGADIVEFPYSMGVYRDMVADDASGPAPLPHIDFSEKGALETAERLLPEQVKKVRRWGIYQTWRALSPVAPVDIPFAVLDSQSLNPKDWMRLDTHSDHVGTYEFVWLHYNPEHRWTYFSQMTRDDIIVFKTYDSDPAKNVPVAHTAFTDPSAPQDAAPRKSFELRAFVAWY